jgi:hypothetical protein
MHKCCFTAKSLNQNGERSAQVLLPSTAGTNSSSHTVRAAVAAKEGWLHAQLQGQLAQPHGQLLVSKRMEDACSDETSTGPLL